MEKIQKKSNFNLWKFLFSYIKHHIKLIIVISLLLTMMAFFDAFAIPKVYQYIVKVLEEAFKNDNNITIYNVIFLACLIPVFSFLRDLCWNFFYKFKETLWIKVRDKIIFDLFNHSVDHSHNYYKSRHSGAVSGKIQQVSSNVFDIINFFTEQATASILAIFFGFVALITVSYKIAIIVFIGTIFTGILQYIFMKRWRQNYKDISEGKIKINSEIVDVIGNISTVRQSGYMDNEKQLLKLNQSNLFKKRIVVIKKMLGFNFFMSSFFELISFMVSFIAVYVAVEEKSLSYYVMTYMVTNSLFVEIKNLMDYFRRFNQNIYETQPLIEDLMLPHEIADMKNAKDLKVLKGEIIFDNVVFKHNDNNKDTLKNFSLVIKPGQTVALVGESGSGKTTMANLIMRSYDTDSGSITIDGQDIKLVKLNSLRKAISFIPQDPQMFKRSIKDNIAYGNKNANMSDIIKASKQAKIHDFVMTLPKKYDTQVGERGINLSGGQRQRVAIARAFLKKTKILILDEATSALDMETEKGIRDSMAKVFKGKTVVMITHRLASAQKMDRIIALKNGKIVEDGTHNSLVKSGGVYAKLLKAEKSQN